MPVCSPPDCFFLQPRESPLPREREDSASVAAETYANIIAVKAGNENSEKIQALIDALKSEAVKKYIQDNYAGAVVPEF